LIERKKLLAWSLVASENVGGGMKMVVVLEVEEEEEEDIN